MPAMTQPMSNDVRKEIIRHLLVCLLSAVVGYFAMR